MDRHKKTTDMKENNCRHLLLMRPYTWNFKKMQVSDRKMGVKSIINTNYRSLIHITRQLEMFMYVRFAPGHI